MTIDQMLQKQKNKLDYIDINYTDEDGISWHSKFIASADIPKVKAIRPIFFNCPIQTFEEVIKIEDRHGVFSINIKDLPKEMIMAENYICPARKTDLDSNNITVRDYLSVRKDIKKVYFIQTYASESYKLNCHTDYFDVQELSGSLSSMANLLVDKAEVIFEDNSVLRIYLPTIECEDEPKQEQYKEKERQKEQEKEREKERKKKQKWLELKESILPVGGYFAFFGFCGMVGGMVGEFNPLFGAIAGIILGVIIII